MQMKWALLLIYLRNTRLTSKGKKRVVANTSGNRKQITIVGCGSAAGRGIPPCIIYPGKRLTAELILGGPLGTRYTRSSNGYITTDTFKKYIQHFAGHSKHTEESPVLLILDGHSSHIELECLEYCSEKHIHLMCLPPHTSHVTQPMDVSVFGPFKNYF
jgi:hypothetical protein